MFDTSLMTNFYKSEFENHEQTIEAWYIYVMHFLPFVNKKWRTYVANEKLSLATPLFKAISISDEALVQWLITLWMPIIKERQAKNWVLDAKDKKKGPHDTKHNIPLYIQIHNDVENKRKDNLAAAKWNQLFWNEVKKRHKEQLESLETNKKSKYSNNHHTKNLLTLPDVDIDQDYLVDYSIDYDAANTLTSLSPERKTNFEEDNESEGEAVEDQD